MKRFIWFYNHLLHRYKYPVQITSGGLLWFSGDLISQYIQQTSMNLFDKQQANESFQSTPDLATKTPAVSSINDTVAFKQSCCSSTEKWMHFTVNVDWGRTLRMTAYGMLFSAPIYTFWYSFLDTLTHKVFNRAVTHAKLPLNVHLKARNATDASSQQKNRWFGSDGWRTWSIIGFKLAADTVLFDPVYLGMFFAVTSMMEGKGVLEIVKKIRKEFVKTYCIDVAVWFPIQTLNFKFVPVIYQPLVVQSCNIGWNAYLSYVQHR